MLGAGALPPNYVRNVTFINASGRSLVIVGEFKSHNKESVNIEANAEVTIEKTIDHGDFQTVDPIESVEVKSTLDSN